MRGSDHGPAAGSGTAGSPLGHHAIIRPRLGPAPEPLPAELCERYRLSASQDVSDVVGRLYSMDSGIRPLYEPISRAAGCAVTVRLPPADNWALAAALTMARRDDVLVVDWMGYRDGCGSGVNSLIPAIRQGLAGVVIDGCWRDVAELRQLDFPVFGRGISAYSPPKHEFGEINVPVCCGGVIVEPGDVIVADREGVAVVPRRHATDVARSLPGTRHEIRKSVSEYPEVSPSLQRRAAAYLRSLELGGIEEVLV